MNNIAADRKSAIIKMSFTVSLKSTTEDLFTVPPRPLVTAAADSSSPIFTHENRSGIILNSTIFTTFPPPSTMPLIFMASLM